MPEGKGATDLGTVMLSPGLTLKGIVIDSKGAPVAGAEVRASATEKREPMRPPSRQPETPADATTQDDGSFALEDRAPGESLDLSVSHPGYGPGSAPGVAVPSEQPVRIVLQPTARVSGKVTGPDRKPVAGAQVAVIEMSPATFSGMSRLMPGRPQRTMTDEEGAFVVEGVSPGAIEVSASAPRRQRARLEGLEVKPGQELSGIDILLLPSGAVEGRVLSADGRPVPGAEVAVIEPSTDEMSIPRFSQLRAATESTDHQGSFRFGGLQEGAYKLTVSTPGGAHHEESVEISGDREIRVELRTASLSGRVVDSLDQSPVSGVRISLEPAQPGDTPLFLPDTQTDARGTFRMLEVGGGAWKLKASRDGYAPAEREIQIDGSTPEEIELSLQPTEGVTVEALLPSGQAPDRIQVVVLGPQGDTVTSGTYPTGENGRTRLSNVPPGRWELLVQSDVSAAAPVTVSVPGPAVRVVLPLSGMLRLKVPALVNDSTAKVVLTGAGGIPFRGIDFGGQAKSEWELYGGQTAFSRVPAGVWQVTVKTADGRSWSGTATVTAGGTAEVTLE